ncbi:Membrane protein insertase YidC [Sphingomonas antarctica]|uniref:membrane protein insertase YidC n=1 Tax=Sphingomonas antarctica TaxID=2040274 RepID=UPI0039E954A6
MENQRNMILAIVLSALVLFGWSALSDRIMPTANPPATRIADGKTTPVATPAVQPVPVVKDTVKAIAATARVPFKNANVSGSINLTGGRVDDLVLTKYGQTIAKNSPPVRLLSPQGTPEAYYAAFGWTGPAGTVPDANTVWTADAAALTPQTPVTLQWTSPQGLRYAIRYAIDDKYMLTVTQAVTNGGAQAATLRPYGFVSRFGKSKDVSAWNAHVGPMGVFNAAANYKVNWKDLDEDAAGERFQTPGGWLGFTDKYWLTALAPAGTGALDAGFRASQGSYQADYAAQPQMIAPGATVQSATHFFAGAKEVGLLDDYAAQFNIPLLGKSVDWGWYEVIEKPIFRYLSWLFHLTGNFGFAIILLTFTVRLLLFPIAQKQFKSMAAMKIVQPKMKALQEKYKEDKPRLQQEIMALYKAEKVNPLAGCLPLVLQVPIFFALYKVLILSTEMRHQPFMLWIHDLSAPDPLTPVNLFGLLAFTPPQMIAIGVLPIILGITQYIQFQLNPQQMDPAQQQIFKIMPWVFMFMMANFATGLIVYWITSNVLTIAQQAWLYSRHPGMKVATT